MNKYAKYLPSIQRMKLAASASNLSLVGKKYWQHLTILAVITLFMLVTTLGVVSCKPHHASAAEFVQGEDRPLSAQAAHLALREIRLPERSFRFWGKPTLILSNTAGRISISNGPQQRISVRATKYISGKNIRPDDLQVTFAQRGNTIEVVGKITRRSTQWTHESQSQQLRIDFEITMPSTGDLQIRAEAGDIAVRGINGEHTLRARAGAITVLRSRLHNVSALTASTGAIMFDGSLDPNGDYSFKTQTGAINVTLPANAAFALHTTGFFGSVNNEFGSSVVGNGPRPPLNIDTLVGLITIKKKTGPKKV